MSCQSHGPFIMQPSCVQCGLELPGSHIHRRYCSGRCKARYRKLHGPREKVTEHQCRSCGKVFPIGLGQGNKWLCSIECVRASNAKSVRNFHERRPQQEAIYRARTKEKCEPDSNILRFYRWNPDAPRSCESCGEHRVLEIAHKPSHQRLGRHRSKLNSSWPEMVWVLCPTCHRLLDRMGYSPSDLGL